MRTPICDRLDIEFPIFAFTHCRDVVAAVSNAGGLGVLGAVGFSPEQLAVELEWLDEHVVDGKTYGVDVVKVDTSHAIGVTNERFFADRTRALKAGVHVCNHPRGAP